MFWSRDNYFKQDTGVLVRNWTAVSNVLKYHFISDTEKYEKAYFYFIYKTDAFDGATIVKDLDDVFGLDLSAMVHDWEYIRNLPKYKGFKWLRYKLKIDYEYGKSMERLGHSLLTSYLRVFGLWLSTPFYLLTMLKKC